MARDRGQTFGRCLLRLISQCSPRSTLKFRLIMKVRRFGETLLRSRDLPVLHFLAPSIYRASVLWLRTSTSLPPRHQKLFSTSAHLCEEEKKPQPQRSPDADFSKAVNTQPKILDLLNATFDPKYDSDKQGSSSSSSSADILENSYNDELYRPEYESRASRRGSIVSGMYMPGSSISDPVLRRATEKLTRDNEKVIPRNTATIKSRPSLGRTVEVTERGVAAALQQLEAECRRNNLRVDQKRQRFHERPGMKRKRLKSERWRKRFRIAFKATVQKVQDMRKKGW